MSSQDIVSLCLIVAGFADLLILPRIMEKAWEKANSRPEKEGAVIKAVRMGGVITIAIGILVKVFL